MLAAFVSLCSKFCTWRSWHQLANTNITFQLSVLSSYEHIRCRKYQVKNNYRRKHITELLLGMWSSKLVNSIDIFWLGSVKLELELELDLNWFLQCSKELELEKSRLDHIPIYYAFLYRQVNKLISCCLMLIFAGGVLEAWISKEQHFRPCSSYLCTLYFGKFISKFSRASTSDMTRGVFKVACLMLALYVIAVNANWPPSFKHCMKFSRLRRYQDRMVSTYFTVFA